MRMVVLTYASVAFDSIDHSLLLDQFQELGMGGKSLAVLPLSLIPGLMGEERSSLRVLFCGMPQISDLDSLLFNIYTKPLEKSSADVGFGIIIC